MCGSDEEESCKGSDEEEGSQEMHDNDSKSEVKTIIKVNYKVPEYWAAWSHLQDYISGGFGAKTYQLFKIRTTASVKTRNKKLAERISNQGFPPEYKWYSKTWYYTHGGRSNDVRKYE